MLVLDEWHLEVLAPPQLQSDVADRLSADIEAAVHQVAEDLTARFRCRIGLRRWRSERRTEPT